MHKACIEFYDELVFNSLKYEKAPRAKIKFYRKNDKKILEIETDSISNLRAAINSFIKWAEMIEEIRKEIKRD